MTRILVLTLVSATLTAAQGQEFDAASVHLNPPRAGFHLASDALTGGPGTADPGMFRCVNCTLATLINRAFGLEGFQFPGKASLGDSTYDVMAKIPAGATSDEFQAMLRNLLSERFALKYHFAEKTLRGYHLTVSTKGSKLKPAGEGAPAPPAGGGAPQWGGGGDHAHSGPMMIHGSGMWRREGQTMADVARMVSGQLNVPVDNQTGLEGKYDISLSWSADAAPSAGHADGAWGGGSAGHGGGSGPAVPADGSGPTLFEALQAQLGLRLVPAAQTAVRIFIVDHVQTTPADN